MVDFVFPSGRKGWIYGVRGTVVGSKTWTETHVSSSGGGGYIHPQYGGQVAAPQIRSTVTEKSEIWIKNTKGKDVLIPLKFPATNGQDVLVLWGNLTGIDSGNYLYWHNFSSEQHGSFSSMKSNANLKFFETVAEEKRRVIITRTLFFAPLILAAIIIFISSGSIADTFAAIFWGGLPGVILAGIAGWLISIMSPFKARINDLEKAMSKLALRPDVSFNG